MTQKTWGGAIAVGFATTLLCTALWTGPAQAIPATAATNATPYKTLVGRAFTFECAPGSVGGAVYGSDVYTTDSSICTAAVHGGRITAAAGGAVTIVIQPGVAEYKSSLRNGVKTTAWGPYPNSFTFVTPIDWNASATRVQGAVVGQRLVYVCPAGGALGGAVYGTLLYTVDSSLCAAAVHAGKITPARGGLITIEIRPGAPAYAAAIRNGVASRSWGAYQTSYLFR